MFFGYPEAATENNWLHNCLVEMVTDIHQRLSDGTSQPDWSQCIPLAHRDKLLRRRGLRDDFLAYRAALSSLTQDERDFVLECMSSQNRVVELLSCQCDCPTVADLPQTIREPVKNLFNRGFALLKALGIRDNQYRQIYESLESLVCPFCGCEPFDAPIIRAIAEDQEEDVDAVREDLDHYLPRSLYPFAAANLRNLAPMGGKCNSYKHETDILRTQQGERRAAFFPYTERSISISLDHSVPFAGADPTKPRWEITFVPESPECDTWDVVFSLRNRLERDVLNPLFNKWIGYFAEWFAREYQTDDDTTVTQALERYASNEAIKGMNGREHFGALILRMLHLRCSENNDRLLGLLRNAIVNTPTRQRSVARLANYSPQSS